MIRPFEAHVSRLATLLLALAALACAREERPAHLTTPIELSPQQIAAFRQALARNSRPVQPLNGRVIAQDVVR